MTISLSVAASWSGPSGKPLMYTFAVRVPYLAFAESELRCAFLGGRPFFLLGVPLAVPFDDTEVSLAEWGQYC